MSYSQSDILKALATVEDPDLKRDLVSLNMIRDVQTGPRKVSFTVVLTTPACPLKEKIRQDCENAVRRVVGEDVEISINITSSVTIQTDNQAGSYLVDLHITAVRQQIRSDRIERCFDLLRQFFNI